MSTAFERVRKPRRGYNVEQVDAFFEAARQQFESGAIPPVVTAEDVRRTGFDLESGGYRIAVVDAALDRLEDSFSDRERQIGLVLRGEAEWLEDVRSRARVVLARCQRPETQRFTRVGGLRYGYSMVDVDRFCDRIARFLVEGEPLSTHQVRNIIFRRRWRGYDERQVDALLDRLVDIMQAAE